VTFSAIAKDLDTLQINTSEVRQEEDIIERDRVVRWIADIGEPKDSGLIPFSDVFKWRPSDKVGRGKIAIEGIAGLDKGEKPEGDK